MKNIVLFVIDTLRADHLGCCGYWRDTSPTIDRLARQGVLFQDARAAAVATGPGFTSIHTGLYAVHHGFYLTPYNVPNAIRFDDNLPTLAEMLWEHGGLTTAAFDNLINFRSHMVQFVRGFEYYVNVTRSPSWIHHHVVGGTVNSRLLPWIRQHADAPFFLFVHYWDPHTPYNQPESWRQVFHVQETGLDGLPAISTEAGYEYVPGWGPLSEASMPPEQRGVAGWPKTSEYPLDLYDGEIRYTDHLVAQVLETLADCGVLDDTVVIVTADHGEQLGQHGLYGHAGLHEANVRIPLVLWNPKFFGPSRPVNGLAQQVDIVPTILDIAGAQMRRSLDGVSLLPVIRGEQALRDTAFMETSQQRAVLHEPWKFIRDMLGARALYNIEQDPAEVCNLIEERPDVARDLEARLDEWLAAEVPEGRIDPMKHCAALRIQAGLDPLEIRAPI